MATISPAFLRDHRLFADGKHWIVYTVNYDSSTRSWKHRTAQGALRRLGSVIAGKLHRNGDHIACAVAPDGELWNYNEIKSGMRRY